MKTLLLLLPLVCLLGTVFGQKDRLSADMLRAEKNYIYSQIPEQYRFGYENEIRQMYMIRPHLYKRIAILDTTFFRGSDSIYVYEFHKKYRDMNGVIWKNNVYYSYSYNNETPLTITVSNDFNALPDSAKAIISNFPNFNHAVFNVSGSQLSSAIENSFFLAEKFKFGKQEDIPVVLCRYPG